MCFYVLAIFIEIRRDWLLSLAELKVNIPPFVLVSCGGITIVG